MGRKILAILFVLLTASCGGRDTTAPRNMNDACSILDQRPHYARAFKRTERRWGVPVHVQMAVMYQESKFIGNAKTPQRFALGIIPLGRVSSAYGYSQALDGTWDDYKKSTGKRRAKRNDIDDAADFVGWYMSGSSRSLGLPMNDAKSHYLAYHEGRGGYARGSYRQKSWLMDVSNSVARRANLYQSQLAYCN
ncbi:transglycosylase SLT domain-containing protein [Pseudooceanicola sp. HF7]|uniref:transglycosylase SLT domain-containing protein n=1 Tax=Pseudooceanicola sp. HF7 TaxID=2721560 RepID=UPI001432087B|nr:transglycosylase SLT domain-containing protein [Pseudooceanicola sp. HF7]NIZ10565.1 lytic transglycosylase [Pseudooceanicola sp. HF7]